MGSSWKTSPKLEDVPVHGRRVSLDRYERRPVGGPGPGGGTPTGAAYQRGETGNGSAANHFLYSSFILPLWCSR